MKRQSKRRIPAPERQIRYARLLGLAFCLGGFVALALGWAGAARRACVDCQIPYLISGGAAGIALVMFGVGLLLIAQIRAEGRRVASRLEQASGDAGRLTGGATVDPATHAAANGRVLAGPSTFHQPDCKLGQGKSGLELVTVEAARAGGLSPCRVCDPLSQGSVTEVLDRGGAEEQRRKQAPGSSIW